MGWSPMPHRPQMSTLSYSKELKLLEAIWCANLIGCCWCCWPYQFMLQIRKKWFRTMINHRSTNGRIKYKNGSDSRRRIWNGRGPRKVAIGRLAQGCLAVHTVELGSFSISAYKVPVGQYKQFLAVQVVRLYRIGWVNTFNGQSPNSWSQLAWCHGLH